jgi:hypothetical protein
METRLGAPESLSGCFVKEKLSCSCQKYSTVLQLIAKARSFDHAAYQFIFDGAISVAFPIAVSTTF